MSICTKFSPCGLIGKSGRWYDCGHGHHNFVMDMYRNDAPFVEVKADGSVMFEGYYTADHVMPTKHQFETLMDWCTEQGETFEAATDCWSEPWQNYK